MMTRIRELSEQMIVIARERVGGSRGIAVENDRAARLWRRLLKEAVTLEELRRGFAECFRVLRSEGTLIFKWNETDVPVSHILALTPVKPLFGNRCGKTAKTHWIVFMKPEAR